MGTAGGHDDGSDDPSARQLSEVAKDLERRVRELEARSFARGTRDVTDLATTASAAPRSGRNDNAALRTRVEAVLAGRVLSIQTLARDLGVATGPVAVIIGELRSEKRVHNLGSSDRPLWVLRVGDVGTAFELESVVRALIGHQPMTLDALVDAAGVAPARVLSVLTAIRRSGSRLVEIGEGDAVRYLLLDGARDATLKPRRPRRAGGTRVVRSVPDTLDPGFDDDDGHN
jgi:hypothetical protein